MSWSASVHSSVTSDTEPTVVVTFQAAKYIFNVGENTNRAFTQSTRNFKKTRAVFLSSLGTQRASGLAGLLMASADSGLSSMDVVGPYGLLHFLASMRKYAYRDCMSLNPREIPWIAPSSSTETDPIYKDENIAVYALSIHGTHHSISSQNMSKTSPEMTSDSSTRALKRKTPSSPPSPLTFAKRYSRVAGSPSSSKSGITLPIQTFMEKTNPARVTGDLAQSWRETIVQMMFSQTTTSRKSKPQETHKKPKSKGKSDDAGSAGQKASQSAARPPRVLPPWYNKSLPPLESVFANSLKPVVAYAVVGPRVRGKFDAKKAEALGLKAGPLRGKLTKGEAVTVMVDNGSGQMVERMIRPEDCMGQSESPGVMLILDTPTLSHIPALISSFASSRLFTSLRSKEVRCQEDPIVRAVFHMCGDGVLDDERYKEFMNGFGSDVQHIVASREYCPDPVTFTSAAFNQLRLNQLDSEIFPVPKHRLECQRDIKLVSSLPENTSSMRSNVVVSIRPPGPPLIDAEAEQHDLFHPAANSLDSFSLPELTLKRFAEAKSAIQDCIENDSIKVQPGDDIIILPLGTGSAVPTKYRNVSGILVQVPNYGNILLDAGEGTWGQLARHFGTEDTPYNVWQALRDLRCIFISHLHADHHMGLAKILAMRQSLSPPAEPLYVVAGYMVVLYLKEYDELESLGLRSESNRVIPIYNDYIHWKEDSTKPWMFKSATEFHSMQQAVSDLRLALGLSSLSTVDVDHGGAKCHGLILKHSDGWSVVYSGDTVPTNKLVQAGTGATLLIHEASMADDQLELAKAKSHSTFGQAVDVGRRMKVQKTLLTHFSARYPKLPPPQIKDESVVIGTGENDMNYESTVVLKHPTALPRPTSMSGSTAKEPILALAFDHASIKIGDMWKMNTYMGAIEQCFDDTAEEGDEDDDTNVQALQPLIEAY